MQPVVVLGGFLITDEAYRPMAQWLHGQGDIDVSVVNPFDPSNREGLIIAAFLLVVAIAGKVAAGWLYASKEPTNRLVVGLGMMPRGEVGLIFLGLGSQAKLLSPSLEAAILLMVIGTTFLAPLLLRFVLTKNETAAEAS